MTETDGERPPGWPEMFPDADLDCNHQYQWDTADGEYRCMYCGLDKQRPPEGHIDTDLASIDGGLPEPAPSSHAPGSCLQIHDVEPTIEQIDSDKVWIRFDCGKCGDDRMIRYTRGGSDE